MNIGVDFGSLEVIEKIPSKFGNGAHVFVSKSLVGRKVKIIIGNSKIIDKKEIKIDFFNSEILEREVSEFGTGAHVILPKDNVGRKIKLIVEGKNE